MGIKNIIQESVGSPKSFRKTIHVVNLWLTLFLMIFVAYSCATVGKPEGGPNDTTAPVLKNSIPEDSSTGFYEKEISIEFNEFISVKNPIQNVIINPAMSKEPEIIVRGKRIIARLSDKPKDNTTYAIDFGSSIVDITAGNILKNFHFVFSSGSKIDTCMLKGRVTIAQSAKPAANIWVILHQKQNDIFDTVPMYKAKTDENGIFNLPFLPEGQFFLFALEDPDGDLKYKAFSEKMAFCDSLISFDSLQSKIKTELWLFQENDTVNKLLRFQRTGKNSAVTSFKSSLPDTKPVFNIPGTLFRYNPNRDTLFAWFPETMSDSLSLSISDGKQIFRSAVFLKEKENKGKVSADTTLILKTNLADNLLIDGDTLTISSKQPIFVNQIDSILLTSEGQLINFRLVKCDSLGMKYFILFQDSPNKNYELKIGKNTFNNFSQFKNQEIKQSFKRSSDNDLGSAVISFNKSFPADAVIILKGKGIEKTVVLQSGKTMIKMDKLPQGDYTAQFILDNNKDGRWTNGSYTKRISPEKNYIFPGTIKIRKSFETKTEWRISD